MKFSVFLRDLESEVKCSGFQMEVFQSTDRIRPGGETGSAYTMPLEDGCGGAEGIVGDRWDCEPRGDSVSTYILLQDEGVPQCRPCLFDTKLNNGVVQSG